MYLFVCGNCASMKLDTRIHFDDAISCMNDRKPLSHHIPSRIWVLVVMCVCVFVARSCCILTKDVSIKDSTNSRGWEKLIFIYSNICIIYTQRHRHCVPMYITIHFHCIPLLHTVYPYRSITYTCCGAFKVSLPFGTILLPWCVHILRFAALDRTCKRHFIFGPRHK